MYAEDVAEGIVLATQRYKSDPINLGTGKEISIKELVELIADIILGDYPLTTRISCYIL